MRLTLKTVRLRNFRIHEDYLFSPSQEGITAIIGDSGKGKSSIIDGVAWALYGTRPSKVTNSTWRRLGSKLSDPCFVEVVIGLDDAHELKVKRSVHGKSGTVQCECWLDGSLEAGPAVTSASKWLPKIIGLDEEGFLTAVLVQQKQLDDIVSKSPAIRQQSIEKLTGITAATKAVRSARDEATALKKALSLMAPDAGNEEEYKKNIASLQNDIKDLEKRRSEIKDSLLTKVQERKESEHSLDAMVEAQKQYTKATYSYEKSKQKFDLLFSRRNELAERITSMRKTLPASTESSSLEKELESAESKLSTMEASIKEMDSIIAKAPSSDVVEEEKKKAKEMESVLGKSNGGLLQESITKHSSEIVLAEANISKAVKSLRDLEGGVEEAVCPTCLQPIDDISHIQDEMRKTISSSQKKKECEENKKKQLEEELKVFEQTSAELDASKKLLSEYVAVLDEANKAMESKKETQRLIPSHRKEVARLRERVSDIKADAQRIANYHSLTSQYEKDSQEFAVANREMEQAKKNLDTLKNPQQRSIDALSKKAERVRAEVETLTSKAVEMKGRRNLLDEKRKNAEEGLARAIKQGNSRKEALARHEAAQAGVMMLSSFREHLAKDAVPQITDYASDLLSDITGGKFISVEMDEKYNVDVIRADGKRMDVHIISGGEQSTVAICLRLAVSSMLSGGSSMLILDEVLTAVDDVRAQAILNAIQNAGHGQVVIIAHNDIIRSVADSVITL